MNRFLSLILLGLLLYNMVGYSIVYLVDEQHSVKAGGGNSIERSEGSPDIIIKVPVAVPYQTSWDKPEEAEGQIEHDGQFYNLVTQQLVNDTLYIHAKFDQNARDQFINLVSKINDQVTGHTPGSQGQPHSTVLKNFLKEYMSAPRKHIIYLFEWVSPRSFGRAADAKLLQSFPKISSPPPKLA